MSDRNVIIVDSIRYQPHCYAFDIWMQAMFRRIDLSRILIYFTDKVQPDVLPILAEEYNLLGQRGWDFAAYEPARREMLNRAMEMHRYKGTPWAIEQALSLVGIIDGCGTVQEGIGTVGDGADWARFGVDIDTSVMIPTTSQINNATILINAFKNARSEFIGFTYV